MKNSDFAVKMNRGGELVQEHMHDFTHNKYRSDSMFLWGPIPYFLMIACVVIDIAFFRSLFVRISYDEPTMIWLEVAGLAFAADVVSAYAGILAKQIKQGLSRDKINLYLLLSVPILALIVNAVLRVATMPLTSVDGSVDAVAIALTIIAIVVPVFTSIGNFAISFQTYDPLGKRMCREEMALDEVREYCRRLRAIKAECDNSSESRMKEMDKKHLANAKKELVSDAYMLYADVRVKLMEHLGDPASTNVLSKSCCDVILERLNRELKLLEELSNSDLDAIDKKDTVSYSNLKAA